MLNNLTTVRKLSTMFPANIVKAVEGHLYLLHIKDNDKDQYVLFRVDELVAGDHVTISWKLIAKPHE